MTLCQKCGRQIPNWARPIVGLACAPILMCVGVVMLLALIGDRCWGVVEDFLNR